MAIPITIPRLGWNMEQGVFVGWLKADGDLVRPGDALFSLESEKATEDVECLDGGILRIAPDGPTAGTTLAVGAVIGYLVEAGELAPFAKKPKQPPAPGASVIVTFTPVAESSPRAGRVAISPRARRVATELAVDWSKLQGSGRTGRIRERDVRSAAARSGQRETIPPSSMRRTIAERMLASHLSTAPVTLTTTVDATNLVNLRQQFQAAPQAEDGDTPGYTDFLVMLTAVALQQHPLLNASWIEGQILLSSGIHIGIAVDTDAGLLVPVLRDVPALSATQLAAQSRDLIERARLGKLTAGEMQGGTFTVTNLGAYGIDAFTPLLHAPQCAILGVGRIQRRPVAVGDAIVARAQLTLSLTFDHRIVDGAPAARFMQTLSALIENPVPCLIRLRS